MYVVIRDYYHGRSPFSRHPPLVLLSSGVARAGQEDEHHQEREGPGGRHAVVMFGDGGGDVNSKGPTSRRISYTSNLPREKGGFRHVHT